MIRQPNWFDGRPADDEAYFQYHIVKRGETLLKIAADYYGDPSFIDALLSANRDVLAESAEIFPGQKLRIP
jgi:nucleoid-associated protein YgaU